MEGLEWDGDDSPAVGVTVQLVSCDPVSPDGWFPGDLVKVLDYAGEQPICWNAGTSTAVPVPISQLGMSPGDKALIKREAAVLEMMGYYPAYLADAPLLFARALYDAGFRGPPLAPDAAPGTL